MNVGGKHTGAKLSNAFIACVVRWFIEKSLFSPTLDNASANAVCVKDVIVRLGKICPLVCDDMFFHVRCANHILNLVARDGLTAIASTIKNIRTFVVAIKRSPLQSEEFMKCAAECQSNSKKGVALDVATRWNSTYLMLMDALYYKNTFNRLLLLDNQRYEDIAPSNEEWSKALSLKCLMKFNDITELLSCTLYPTANLFYRNFCDIKLLLAEWCVSNDITIKTMTISMSAKFDKYWKKSNVALNVASFLDPRFKKGIIEFYMKKIYGELMYQAETEKFMKIVKQLFQQYVSAAPNATKSSATSPSLSETSKTRDLLMGEECNELESFLYYTDNVRADVVNDLDKYTTEPSIFSQLARDVLAMQVSTVASESAFSVGGRVIDPRSRLDPDIVEALICINDWVVVCKKGSQKNFASIVGDLEVMETLFANMVVKIKKMEDEEEMVSDED